MKRLSETPALTGGKNEERGSALVGVLVFALFLTVAAAAVASLAFQSGESGRGTVSYEQDLSDARGGIVYAYAVAEQLASGRAHSKGADRRAPDWPEAGEAAVAALFPPAPPGAPFVLLPKVRTGAHPGTWIVDVTSREGPVALRSEFAVTSTARSASDRNGRGRRWSVGPPTQPVLVQ